MKCPNCKLILLSIILMVTIGSTLQQPEGLSNVAKRSFLARERDYLKSKPISNDLRRFIRRFKRKIPVLYLQQSIAKNKRDDEKEHMFIVEHGNIVPLVNKDEVTAAPAGDSTGIGNFTVIPLVIPITLKVFTNATICDNSTEAGEYNEENSHVGKPGKDEVEPNTTEATEMIVDSAISTRDSTNLKVLNKVLNDVQVLISHEKEGKSTGDNEGALCTVIGDWDSSVGGMQLQIAHRNESVHSPSVEIVEQTPPVDVGFLHNETWNITSNMPYNHSSLIILTAVSEKSVAVFIGDCRICAGLETIIGNWMLTRRSSSCKDRQQAQSFLSDVMRKSNIRRLQKQHLAILSSRASTVPTTSTTL